MRENGLMQSFRTVASTAVVGCVLGVIATALGVLDGSIASAALLFAVAGLLAGIGVAIIRSRERSAGDR
ncbi:hypothetical protein [Streptomyces sp. AcH 505]|uniref:hypothetical protein n=1 Tax=Streptomyces sp. AcH 505 TaxID=352211 RepID=UPI0012FF27E0